MEGSVFQNVLSTDLMPPGQYEPGKGTHPPAWPQLPPLLLCRQRQVVGTSQARTRLARLLSLVRAC